MTRRKLAMLFLPAALVLALAAAFITLIQNAEQFVYGQINGRITIVWQEVRRNSLTGFIIFKKFTTKRPTCTYNHIGNKSQILAFFAGMYQHINPLIAHPNQPAFDFFDNEETKT